MCWVQVQVMDLRASLMLQGLQQQMQRLFQAVFAAVRSHLDLQNSGAKGANVGKVHVSMMLGTLLSRLFTAVHAARCMLLPALVVMTGPACCASSGCADRLSASCMPSGCTARPAARTSHSLKQHP